MRVDNSSNVKRRSYLKSIAASSAALTMAGCLSDGDQSDQGDVLELSVAGAQSGVSGILANVTADQGFASERELAVTVQLTDVGGATDLLVNRQTDVGLLQPTLAGRLNSRGQQMRIFEPYYGIHIAAFAREGTDIESLEDLQDVPVATLGRGTSLYNYFWMFTEFAGLDIDEFDLRFGSPAVNFGLLVDGEVDAILTNDPYSGRLLANDHAYEVFHYRDRFIEDTGFNALTSGVGAYQDTIDEKPEAIRQYGLAVREAGEYISNNLGEVIETYEDVLGLETEEERQITEERLEVVFPPFEEDVIEGSKEAIRLAGEELDMYEEGPIEDIDEIFISPEDLE